MPNALTKIAADNTGVLFASPAHVIAGTEQEENSMSDSSLPPSLKKKIADRKRGARNRAAANMIAGASFTAVFLLSRQWPWLVLLAAMGTAFALNTYVWFGARKAQRVYEDNPAAAYITEVRNAFGG